MNAIEEEYENEQGKGIKKTLDKIDNYLALHGSRLSKNGHMPIDIIDSALSNACLYNNTIGQARDGLTLQQTEALYNWFDYCVEEGNLRRFHEIITELKTGRRKALALNPFDARRSRIAFINGTGN